MTDAPPGEIRRANAAMLLYAFLVSTSFPVVAAITHGLEPEVMTFLRFCFATLVLGSILGLRGELSLPGPGALLRYAAISLAIVLFFISMFEALRWTDPLSTGALFTLVPLMAAGFAFLLNRQRSGTAQLVCLLVGAAGALWVLFDGSLQKLLGLSLGRGELIFGLGCLSFALYSPLIARLHRGEPASVVTFWSIATGAVMLALYCAPSLPSIDWVAVPAGVWLGIAYLATFNTVGTFMMAKYASVRLPGHKVMAYTYLTPAFVALLEGAIGHGWPVPIVVVGILVAASATVLLQRV